MGYDPDSRFARDPLAVKCNIRARVAKQILATLAAFRSKKKGLEQLSVPFLLLHARDDHFSDPSGSVGAALFCS
jgi:hypothetical protein